MNPPVVSTQAAPHTSIMALQAHRHREAPTTADIVTALARDVAPDRIRTDRLATFAVDGVVPSVVVRPAHPDEAAGALARCNDLHAAVVPRGGSTQMLLGNLPKHVDVVLDTTALNEIVAYTPADLTLGVQAGTTLEAVQARLRLNGQHLPLDPPFAECATIGGLTATNMSGPRRVASGSLRDLVIGTEVAGTDGTITKSGGMVVKNVTGYDIHKAHIGALGTLGLLTRINLKVAPLPANERTVVYCFTSALEASAAVGSIVSAPITPTAVDIVDSRLVSAVDTPDCPWLLAVRVSGSEVGVTAQADALHDALASDSHRIQSIEGAAQQVFWREAVSAAEPPPDGSSHVVCRISSLSSQIGSLLASAGDIATGHGLDWRAEAHAINGVGRVRLTGTATGALVAAVRDLRDTASTFDAAIVVEAAPVDVKRDIDVWGVNPKSTIMDTARALRLAFDPNHTLNPGRFVADLT